MIDTSRESRISFYGIHNVVEDENSVKRIGICKILLGYSNKQRRITIITEIGTADPVFVDNSINILDQINVALEKLRYYVANFVQGDNDSVYTGELWMDKVSNNDVCA